MNTPTPESMKLRRQAGMLPDEVALNLIAGAEAIEEVVRLRAENDQLRRERDALTETCVEHHDGYMLGAHQVNEDWRAVILGRSADNAVSASWQSFPTKAEAVNAVRKVAGLAGEGGAT